VSDSHSEMLRRLRLGNLRTLFHHRYGPELPDDDAGREDLRELLLPISVGPNADIKIRKAMEIWASWLSIAEATQLIDQINRTPIYHRKPNAQQLGFRQRVTNAERERLRLWTIAPYDMTAEELQEQRRTKDRNRKRRRRRKAGSVPRSAYLAKSLSRQKPWEIAGISRRTWYRRRGTSPSEVELVKSGTDLCHQKIRSRDHKGVGRAINGTQPALGPMTALVQKRT
jgi:hypothetical protein